MFSSTLVGLAVPTKRSKSFMDKAAKLKFVSATEPVIEQSLPVGYNPALSSEVLSVAEQQDDDDKEESDEAVAKGDENVDQVCQCKIQNKVLKYKKLPPVRIELTTLRL